MPIEGSRLRIISGHLPRDLEGTLAKWDAAPYRPELALSSGIKIRILASGLAERGARRRRAAPGTVRTPATPGAPVGPVGWLIQACRLIAWAAVDFNVTGH
jgi:hypothetical protein